MATKTKAKKSTKPRSKKSKAEANGSAEKPPVTERKHLHQQSLPTIEPQEPIPELDDAARIYFEAMHDRKTAGESEDEAKQSLIMKMKEHGQKRYESANGFVVTITDKANVKCKKKGKEDEAEEKDEFGGEE